MSGSYKLLLWHIFISTILVALIVSIGMIFYGCANDKAMNKTETLTAILQPAYDDLGYVCPLAVVGAQSTGLDQDKVRAKCRNIKGAFDKVKVLQEIEIINAGGEPCLENCSTSP